MDKNTNVCTNAKEDNRMLSTSELRRTLMKLTVRTVIANVLVGLSLMCLLSSPAASSRLSALRSSRPSEASLAGCSVRQPQPSEMRSLVLSSVYAADDRYASFP